MLSASSLHGPLPRLAKKTTLLCMFQTFKVKYSFVHAVSLQRESRNGTGSRIVQDFPPSAAAARACRLLGPVDKCNPQTHTDTHNRLGHLTHELTDSQTP